jgi:hypothetical protein
MYVPACMSWLRPSNPSPVEVNVQERNFNLFINQIFCLIKGIDGFALPQIFCHNTMMDSFAWMILNNFQMLKVRVNDCIELMIGIALGWFFAFDYVIYFLSIILVQFTFLQFTSLIQSHLSAS